MARTGETLYHAGSLSWDISRPCAAIIMHLVRSRLCPEPFPDTKQIFECEELSTAAECFVDCTFSLLQLQALESLLRGSPRKNLVSVCSLRRVPVTSHIKNVLPGCLTRSVSTCSSVSFVQLAPRQNFQKYPSLNQKAKGFGLRGHLLLQPQAIPMLTWCSQPQNGKQAKARPSEVSAVHSVSATDRHAV